MPITPIFFDPALSQVLGFTHRFRSVRRFTSPDSDERTCATQARFDTLASYN